jgi:hypothetical protein
MIPAHKSGSSVKAIQLFLYINVSPAEEIGFCEVRQEIRRRLTEDNHQGLGSLLLLCRRLPEASHQKVSRQWVHLSLVPLAISSSRSQRGIETRLLCACTGQVLRIYDASYSRINAELINKKQRIFVSEFFVLPRSDTIQTGNY